ncbi:hypothetical protein ACLH2J_01865 [Klebsiella michiganensis]|uniref:hypothetical protein n=1 Tax=Klebsiella michiganensis TaxID=1134687 RepID=UPI003983202E
MAIAKPDIFVGSYVRVAINKDTSTEIPSYFDPGYIETKNLAAFPSISLSPEVQTVEEYRDDFVVKLSGDVNVQNTQLSILNVPDDPVIQELDEALKNKQPLRFRNLYVIDTENGENSQNGLYHIFDAYVSKMTTSGGADSIVTNNYTLSPTGKVFQGFAQVGEILREGDYGIGAGTEDIPGVKDLGLLTGNRWITVDASNSQNPFGSDTSAMAIQHPNKLGWEIIGQTVGAPAIRIRNKKQNADGTVTSSNWVKVYSETDKPQAVDNDFVSKADGGTYGNSVYAPALYAKTNGASSVYVDAGTGNAHVWFRTNTTERGVIWATPNTADLGAINIRAKTTDGKSSGDFQFRSDGQFISPSHISVGTAPTAAQHLTRKDYVDNGLNKKINIGSTIDFGTF